MRHYDEDDSKAERLNGKTMRSAEAGVRWGRHTNIIIWEHVMKRGVGHGKDLQSVILKETGAYEVKDDG